MSRLLRLGSLLLPLLTVAAGDGAEWTVARILDPLSQEEVQAATVHNEDGFALSLFREGGGTRVNGLFRFPAGRLDFLDPGRSPSFRIDGQATQQTYHLAGELKWAEFPVWHGEGEALTGTLRDLMEGEMLTFTYYLHGGGYKETIFTLAGAKGTIAEILGIRADVSREERERAAALEAATQAAVDSCVALKKKPREQCLARLRVCGDEHPETAAELRECLR
jgi:hypothetical protein